MRTNPKNSKASEKAITLSRELINRRRFVRGVAAGTVLAFGMGIPTPSSTHAGIVDSVIYYAKKAYELYKDYKDIRGK